MSLSRRLAHGTDADRVIAAVIDPLFAGASPREIAAELRLDPTYVEEQCAVIAHERGVAALLARAEDVRLRLADLPASCRPDIGSAVALLEAALTHVEATATRKAVRLAQRLATAPEHAAATHVAATKVTGGARPPEQSRGATGSRNPVGGPSQDVRGSYVEGRRAYR